MHVTASGLSGKAMNFLSSENFLGYLMGWYRQILLMANIGGASTATLLAFAIGKGVFTALIEGVLYLAFPWDLLWAFFLVI